ncbi:MAG TPA: NOL1/NOP2/sun family putative RNA methylase [Armatimonadetes bacterium]|nr:NOL1/NOP2/sun family putative RNA methylase [Armatimonadota bacterium]
MKINPELQALVQDLLGEEAEDFWNAVGQPPKTVIRVNTLKTTPLALRKRLERAGFALTELPLAIPAFRVEEEPFPIGKTFEHFVGLFYVQSLASLLPPLALAPQPADWVLDIAAAPGSKATELAQLMDNHGLLVANDVSPSRMRALVHNVERLGIVNTGLMQQDGNRLGRCFRETFDRALVDVPCSALGTLGKSPEVTQRWMWRQATRLAQGQYQLLLSAAHTLRVGGTLVYSTCTLTPQENEGVISSFLRKYPFEVASLHFASVPTRPGLTQFGGETFDERVARAVRLYPFEAETEGFFIAKLVKTDSLPPVPAARTPREVSWRPLEADDSQVHPLLTALEERYGLPSTVWEPYLFGRRKDELWLLSRGWAEGPRELMERVGMRVARRYRERAWRLTTGGAQLLAPFITRQVVDLRSGEELLQFVAGGTVDAPPDLRGPVVARYDGLIVGSGVVTPTGLKGQVPRSRRFEFFPPS